MSNLVHTEFTVDADTLFATADKVEARYEEIRRNASRPIVLGPTQASGVTGTGGAGVGSAQTVGNNARLYSEKALATAQQAIRAERIQAEAQTEATISGNYVTAEAERIATTKRFRDERGRFITKEAYDEIQAVKAKNEAIRALNSEMFLRATSTTSPAGLSQGRLRNAKADIDALEKEMFGSLSQEAVQVVEKTKRQLALSNTGYTGPDVMDPAERLRTEKTLADTRKHIQETARKDTAAAEEKAAKASLARGLEISAARAAQDAKDVRFRALVNAEKAKLAQAETAVEAAEATKRTAIRRTEARSSGVLQLGRGVARGVGIGGLGGGITSPVAIGAAIVIGGIVKSLNVYREELEKVEGRTARLQVASRDFGTSQEELAKQVDLVSNRLKINKEVAESLVVPIAEIAQGARGSVKELTDSVVDLAAARGIDKKELPNVLKDVAAGSANTALLGRNAAAVFDIYAHSLGTTAEKLTEVQKAEALIKETNRQGAAAAGTQAQQLSNQAVSFEQVGKAATSAAAAVGGFFTSFVKSNLDSLTNLAGGTPEFGLFDPAKNGSALRSDWILQALGYDRDPQKVYAEDIKIVEEFERKRREGAVKTIQENQKLLSDALADPGKDVVTRAVSRINPASLVGLTPTDQREVIQKAIEDRKTLERGMVEPFKKAIENARNNIPELQRLSREVTSSLFGGVDEDAIKQITDQASQAISAGYRRILTQANENIGLLKSTRAQIIATPELTNLDRQGLFDDVTKQLEQAIERQKEKVKELGETFKGAFDTIRSRTAQGNPFLQFLTEADRRARDFDKSMKGVPAGIRAVLTEMQKVADARELFKLRLDARVGAVDLRQRAQDFRRGYNEIPAPTEEEIRNDPTVKSAQGRIDAIDKARRDEQFRQADEEGRRRIREDEARAQAQKEIEERKAKIEKELEEKRKLELQQRVDEKIQAVTGGSRGRFSSTGFPAVLSPNGRNLSEREYEEAQRRALQERTQGAAQKALQEAADTRVQDNIDQRTADQRLIQETQGLDPTKLRDDQRQVIAETLEREARATLEAEAEAQKERVKQRVVQEKMEIYLGALLKNITEGDGLPVDLRGQATVNVEINAPAGTTARTTLRGGGRTTRETMGR